MAEMDQVAVVGEKLIMELHAGSNVANIVVQGRYKRKVIQA